MNQAQESSVLFSLRELMSLEEQRVADEQASQRRRAELAAEAERSAARASREEEDRRRREADGLARVEAEQTRAEAVRLAAIRDAAIERARQEAEGAVRLEELRVRHEHEERVTALRQDRQRRRFSLLTCVLGTLLVAVLVLGGLRVRDLVDDVVASRERLRVASLGQQAVTNELEEALRTERARLAALERSAAEASAPHPPASTGEGAPQAAPVHTGPSPGAVRPVRPGAPASAAKCAHAWDPLCMQLP